MVASSIASAIGSSEGAVKLLLTIFIGYPLAFLYRSKPVYSLPTHSRHILFIVIGLLIGYYNFGLGVLHSIANTTIVYLVLSLFGGNKFTVCFVFAFSTGYLVLGYYYQISRQYGISWTMPHCVLTLRMIAVAFDFYDGQKKNVSKDLQATALQKCPSLLEMFSHTFYFGGYMVGPQFSFRRYLDFINGDFSNAKTGEAPKSVSAGLKRFLVGFTYIFIYQCLYLFVPDHYLNTQEFYNLNIFYKSALIILWGKNCLHKYIGVWIMQEGVIILTGMSYNGEDDKGHVKWDGCTNIQVKDLELGYTFSDFIRSFNINTNLWMSRYVFKRLRFLGNKMLSQVLTLFYLALWHGLQSGYYVSFFLELIFTNSEKKLDVAINLVHDTYKVPDWKALRVLHYAIRKWLLLFLWAYALVPFSLLDFDKWFMVYHNSWYLGVVIPIIGGPICHMIIMAVPRKQLSSNGVSHPVDTQMSDSGDAKVDTETTDKTDNNVKKDL